MLSAVGARRARGFAWRPAVHPGGVGTGEGSPPGEGSGLLLAEIRPPPPQAVYQFQFQQGRAAGVGREGQRGRLRGGAEGGGGAAAGPTRRLVYVCSKPGGVGNCYQVLFRLRCSHCSNPTVYASKPGTTRCGVGRRWGSGSPRLASGVNCGSKNYVILHRGPLTTLEARTRDLKR